MIHKNRNASEQLEHVIVDIWMYAGFLSGFWSRGVEMRRNVLLGGEVILYS